MRQSRTVALILLILLLVGMFASTVIAQEATEEPMTETTEEPTPESTEEPATEATEEPAVETGATYTVQPGDNLYRIALRFGTTTSALAAANGIANPSLIFVGQVLQIPGEGPVTTPEAQPEEPEPPAEPTQEPAAGGTYVVQPGDNLFRIAVRNNTTVAELAAINNISNPRLIFVGQRLTIPGATETVPPGETTTDTGAPSETTALDDAGFDYGISAFFEGQDATALAQQVTQLGMNWVKVRVDWREMEATQGQISFSNLDSIVDALESNDLSILFTVTNAPAWARTSPNENGPPDDLTNFTDFVGELAQRYVGRVGAYEIWEEPNLRRNWNCDRQMCDTDYLVMLRRAYTVIKVADPNALVISAGPAPTRFNDRVNAINDRIFLETLYANGLAEVSDGIGTHPLGWGNPPDARCCEQPSGVETHYENDSFYFLENLEAYRNIMEKYGDTGTALWVTKFGWGTSEDTDPPGEINIFVTYTSLSEQALYIPRAFELGDELGYVGPMFLSNLNGCQATLGRAEFCHMALLGPEGTSRPAFDAVQSLDKSDASARFR